MAVSALWICVLTYTLLSNKVAVLADDAAVPIPQPLSAPPSDQEGYNEFQPEDYAGYHTHGICMCKYAGSYVVSRTPNTGLKYPCLCRWCAKNTYQDETYTLREKCLPCDICRYTEIEKKCTPYNNAKCSNYFLFWSDQWRNFTDRLQEQDEKINSYSKLFYSVVNNCNRSEEERCTSLEHRMNEIEKETSEALRKAREEQAVENEKTKNYCHSTVQEVNDLQEQNNAQNEAEWRSLDSEAKRQKERMEAVFDMMEDDLAINKNQLENRMSKMYEDIINNRITGENIMTYQKNKADEFESRLQKIEDTVTKLEAHIAKNTKDLQAFLTKVNRKKPKQKQ